MTSIALVVATDRRGVIGRDGKLPWHLPDDLRRFKSLTMGKPIVMGRKTWDSIGRPLPGRLNIVISRQDALVLQGATVVRSFEQAVQAAGDVPEVCVIGGADIFRQALPMAHTIYLTLVDADVDGDVSMPPLDRSVWLQTAAERHAADDRHAWPFDFLTLQRRR